MWLELPISMGPISLLYNISNGNLGNVNHVVHEMAILICYGLVPFGLRSSQNA